MIWRGSAFAATISERTELGEAALGERFGAVELTKEEVVAGAHPQRVRVHARIGAIAEQQRGVEPARAPARRDV
jgi:hypothetical protein